MREIHKHYNKFVELGKKQKKHVLENFTKTSISKQYENLFSDIEELLPIIPKNTELKLPKLKLPKIDAPKQKFPKLNKV